MSEESVSLTELVDALDEAAKASLEMYGSFLDGISMKGVIVEEGAETLARDWQADLKRWNAVLIRHGRDIGDIPEPGSVGS